MHLPSEFVRRMESMLGPGSQEFFNSFHGERYSGVRANLLKTSVDNFQQVLPFSLSSIPWCASGFYYDGEEELKRGLRPGKHPFHEAGLYYIQEPSAMAVAEAAGPVLRTRLTANEKGRERGEEEKPLRVLDLCAAPGGKSSQLASILGGRGFLVSNEIHPARAKILSQNMERMGLTNGMVISHSPEELGARFPRCFDVIVVDAPCSGEGMFRKDEATVEQWSPENVQMCARRQKDILIDAVSMLAPGGTLIYSTCTFAPAENEGVLLWLLRTWPELETVPAFAGSSRFDQGHPEWVTEEFGCEDAGELTDREKQQIRMARRLWPHHVRGEGHFLVKLRRRSDSGEAFDGEETDRELSRSWMGRGEKKKGKKSGGASPNRTLSRPPAEWEEFAAEMFGDGAAVLTRICGPGFQWLMFGEQLYAIGADCPGLDGLTVLRPGLHLGTVKKGRFEPSHALALAVTPNAIEDLGLWQRCAELWNPAVGNGDALAERWLRGEALADTALARLPRSGWNLMTYRGVPLGWGKVSGGAVKNHYPKGLRWV